MPSAGHASVGLMVCKYFTDTSGQSLPYTGRVAKYLGKASGFLVSYGDGDTETVGADELEEMAALFGREGGGSEFLNAKVAKWFERGGDCGEMKCYSGVAGALGKGGRVRVTYEDGDVEHVPAAAVAGMVALHRELVASNALMCQTDPFSSLVCQVGDAPCLHCRRHSPGLPPRLAPSASSGSSSSASSGSSSSSRSSAPRTSSPPLLSLPAPLSPLPEAGAAAAPPVPLSVKRSALSGTTKLVLDLLNHPLGLTLSASAAGSATVTAVDKDSVFAGMDTGRWRITSVKVDGKTHEGGREVVRAVGGIRRRQRAKEKGGGKGGGSRRVVVALES
jgi:hypothetical protein